MKDVLNARLRGLLPKGLRGRLMLLLIVVLVPTVLAQLVFSFRGLEERRAREQDSSLDVARTVAVAFDGYIRDVLRTELAMGLHLADSRITGDEADRDLTAVAKTYPSLRELSWIDPNGLIIASSNPLVKGVEVQDREYYQSIKSGQDWVVSDLLLARVGGEPVVVVAQAIRDDSARLQGIVIATVLPQRLGDLDLPLARGGQGTIRIVDKKGFLVYRWPFVDLSWEERSLLPGDGLLARALTGQEAVGTHLSTIDHKEHIAGVVPMRATGWAASASVSVSEVMEPAIADLVTQVALTMLAAGSAFVIALLLSETISGPIVRLREQAAALARGESVGEVKVGGPRELTDLGATFDGMAQQVQERTAQLEASNKELQDFAYSVAHDLRAPLRHINSFSQLLLNEYADRLDDRGKEYLQFQSKASEKMGQLIDDLLKLSRVTRAEIRRQPVNLSEIAKSIADKPPKEQTDRQEELIIEPNLVVRGDPQLLRLALENLLGNARKFTLGRPVAKIEFGVTRQDGEPVYFVRDNGVGFDMAYVGKLFGAFQRLHRAEEFPGTGIGLAIVQRIIQRHGGRVWAEGKVDNGATFYFTLS